MKALITGVNGFSGRPLAAVLADRGVEVHGVDLQPERDPRVALASYGSLDLAKSDLADTVGHIQPDWVFHLAGMTGGDPVKVYEVNVQGAARLLEAIHRKAPAAKVLLVGSAAEYGVPEDPSAPVSELQPCRPQGAYGISKYAATLIAQDYSRRLGLDTRVMRPFNIVGPGIPTSLVLGAVISRAVSALRDQAVPKIQIGNLESARDFVAIEDVVEAYLLAIEKGGSGEVYNIASGVGTRIGDLVRMAISFAPKPIGLEVDPALLRPNDVPVFVGDGTKATRELGFTPKRDLTSSIQAAWEYALSR